MGGGTSGITQHYHGIDKLEIDADAQSEMDPFYYTGYQTYMFAYMMDAYSDVPLTWLGGSAYPVTSRVDGADNYHVTISTIDESGNVRPNFYSWRNQIITGGLASGQNGRDVKSVIRSVASVPAYQLYQGTYVRNVGPGPEREKFYNGCSYQVILRRAY